MYFHHRKKTKENFLEIKSFFLEFCCFFRFHLNLLFAHAMRDYGIFHGLKHACRCFGKKKSFVPKVLRKTLLNFFKVKVTLRDMASQEWQIFVNDWCKAENFKWRHEKPSCKACKKVVNLETVVDVIRECD